MGERAVLVDGLRKAYGDHVAVDGVSFEVAAGEIVSILGPNGAGKTTTLEILEGYRDRDGGRVEVLGLDPASRSGQLRGRTGIVLQECEAEPHLTVGETLEQFRAYYPSPRPVAELLELVDLGGQATTRVHRLSGGQRRRLDLAVALVGNPELVFLDEPTTGFDPAARRGAWEVVRRLRDLGTTVVLTTHYLDEAETLSDRLIVLVGGAQLPRGHRLTSVGATARLASASTQSARPMAAHSRCRRPMGGAGWTSLNRWSLSTSSPRGRSASTSTCPISTWVDAASKTSTWS